MRTARLVAMVALILASTAREPSADVSTSSFFSHALDRPLSYAVYRPKEAAGGLPLLYLLHGLGGGFRDWLDLGHVEGTLDRLVADGTIQPLIVVMPEADNGWYVDSAAIGGPGDYQTAIGEELLAHIEGDMPVPRERRLIAGLSMGGFGAIRLALSRPDRFLAAAGMSAAVWPDLPEVSLEFLVTELEHLVPKLTPGRKADLQQDPPPPGAFFHGAFGEPFDPLLFNRGNVFTLLDNLPAEGPRPAIFLTVGDDDAHWFYRGNTELYQALVDQGLDAELRVTDGHHDWRLWAQEIETVLRWFDVELTSHRVGD